MRQSLYHIFAISMLLHFKVSIQNRRTEALQLCSPYIPFMLEGITKVELDSTAGIPTMAQLSSFQKVAIIHHAIKGNFRVLNRLMLYRQTLNV